MQCYQPLARNSKLFLFRDVFSIFNSPEATKALQSLISKHCSSLKGKVNVVCALESRGFLFGPQIALELQVPFVPIRKQGKLPGEVAKVAFQLEYGTVGIFFTYFKIPEF